MGVFESKVISSIIYGNTTSVRNVNAKTFVSLSKYNRFVNKENALKIAVLIDFHLKYKTSQALLLLWEGNTGNI